MWLLGTGSVGIWPNITSRLAENLIWAKYENRRLNPTAAAGHENKRISNWVNLQMKVIISLPLYGGGGLCFQLEVRSPIKFILTQSTSVICLTSDIWLLCGEAFIFILSAVTRWCQINQEAMKENSKTLCKVILWYHLNYFRIQSFNQSVLSGKVLQET